MKTNGEQLPRMGPRTPARVSRVGAEFRIRENRGARLDCAGRPYLAGIHSFSACRRCSVLVEYRLVADRHLAYGMAPASDALWRHAVSCHVLRVVCRSPVFDHLHHPKQEAVFCNAEFFYSHHDRAADQ